MEQIVKVEKQTDITGRKHKIAYLMHGMRNIGGGEYSLYFLISGLDKSIFEPVVLYASENEIVRRLRLDGVRSVKVPLSDKITAVYRDEIKRDFISQFFYSTGIISGIFRVSKILKREKVDLLHPHDNLSKIIGGLAAKISGTRVIAHCRDLLKGSAIEKFLKYFQVLFMDRVIAVSQKNRELFKIRDKISKKVKVVYNGLDLKRFEESVKQVSRRDFAIGEDAFVVTMVGVFDRCKGHIYLFEAVKKLVSEGYANIICLVVGNGRLKNELHHYVESEGLRDNIKFLGYRNDISSILTITDLLVVPSIRESFPRVPLEAMAMQVPVVTTTVGGIPESVDDGVTGLLVPPRDPKALSDAIEYLFKNSQVRSRMGKTGRRRVEEKFSIERNIDETQKIYFELLDAK